MNVHELKDGMFYSTRWSRVEWNIPAFNEWTYLHYCTNEKHSLFVLYNIQVDLCHFDWKIQLSKQTKRRPTIFKCEITPVSFWVGLLDSTVTMCILDSYFEIRRSRMLVFWLICLAVTLLRYQRHAHAVMFLLCFFIPSERYYCTLPAYMVKLSHCFRTFTYFEMLWRKNLHQCFGKQKFSPQRVKPSHSCEEITKTWNMFFIMIVASTTYSDLLCIA